MGSIPATLDILLSDARSRINNIPKFKFYSKFFKTNFSYTFHVRRHNKSLYNVFFSYETLSFFGYQGVQPYILNWNWSQFRAHHFLSCLYLWKWFDGKRKPSSVKPISAMVNFNALHLSSTPPKLNFDHRDHLSNRFKFTKTTVSLTQPYSTRVLNCLQVYLDNVNSISTFINFRTLVNGLRWTNHENWFLDTLFYTWIALTRNLQDLNLDNKRQFRQYFKFYNYWFEYSRLAFVSYPIITVSNATFSLNSIGFKRLPNLNFSSLKLGLRDTTAQLPQSLLTYTVLESLNKAKCLSIKSTLPHYFSVLSSPITCSQGRSVGRLNVFSNLSVTFSNRRFRPLSHFNLRHVLWSRKQRSYLFRNKRWKCRLRTNRTYITSFRLYRKFRHRTIYRKFIPKILRALALSSYPEVNIAYKSLTFSKTLSHTLTRDSTLHSYTSISSFNLSQISNLYLVLSECARQVTSSRSNESSTICTSSNLVRGRLSSIINQKLIIEPHILQFTSSQFFMSLLTHSNLTMWKYSVTVPSLIVSSRILLYSVTQSLKSISQMLSYVVQTQSHGYNVTPLLRYITHSNLSLLTLNEYYTLIPIKKFIDSKVLQYYSSRYLRPNGFFWYYTALIQFLEDTTGRKVAFNFGPFLETALTFSDRARCLMWGSRIAGFQRILGPKIFIYEALDVLVTSIRLKDPTFLANWIRAMLLRMSFWKYRLIFRYLKFLLHNLIKSSFEHFSFKGAKFRLKGKISVAGNARTRMIFYRVGLTTHTTMANRVSYDLSYVNTFTGIQGFKIWFFY